MVLAIGPRVQQTSTTTGTGAYNLDNTIPDAHTGFVAEIGDTNTCHCLVTDSASNDWEWGIYTVGDAAPDTLTRTDVKRSTNANSAVNWGAGTRTIDVIWPVDVTEMLAVIGVSAGAEVNPAVVSQGDAEAGTATDERIWTAQRVSQAIDALAGGGAWTLIGTQVASNSASLTQTGLDSTYGTYAIAFADIVPVDDGAILYFRVGDSAGIDSGASDYSWGNSKIVANSTSGAEIYNEDNLDAQIRGAVEGAGNAAGEGVGGLMYLHRPGDGSSKPHFTGMSSGFDGNNDLFVGLLGGARLANITLDRIQVLMHSGNINSGRMTVWGISHI